MSNSKKKIDWNKELIRKFMYAEGFMMIYERKQLLIQVGALKKK